MDSPEHEQVRELTGLLRSGNDPFWLRMRALLLEKGVDPQRALLAQCFPDDNSFEFGIVVSGERSIFQFGFDYLHQKIEDGRFSEWDDLTDRFQSTPYRASIEAALDLM